MPRLSYAIAAFALTCCTVAAGCARDANPRPLPPEANEPGAHAPTPVETSTKATGPHIQSHRAQAPLDLSVAAKEDGERLTLELTLHARGRLAASPTLELTLGPGTELIHGDLQEALPPLSPGAEVRRTFVVSGTQPQLTFVAHAIGPHSGATARAEWPPPANPKADIPQPQLQPLPAPVHLEGHRIEQAIPLN